MDAAVFIDRDNTLIRNDGDLGDPDQVRLIQGAATAIASLCGLGYKVVVVSNQGGVARGKFTEADVEAVNRRIRDDVSDSANGARIDRFYYCPYHPQGRVRKYQKEHANRKPKPGMMLQAAREMRLDLSQSWTVGDQVRDVEAGKAAGTRTILIGSASNPSQQETPPRRGKSHQPDYRARSLVEAVRIIAQQRKPETIRQPHVPSPSKKWDAAAVAELQKHCSNPQAGEPADPQSKSPPAEPTRSKPAPPAQQSPVTGRPKPRSQPRSAAPPRRTERVAPTPLSVSGAEPSVPTPQVESDHGVGDSSMPDGPRHLHQTSASVEPPAQVTQMRQILRELRQLRGAETDFSYVRVMAIVVQMIALLCLLGAFWMGHGDQAVFIRCLGTGLLLQLTTIAMLLFSK